MLHFSVDSFLIFLIIAAVVALILVVYSIRRPGGNNIQKKLQLYGIRSQSVKQKDLTEPFFNRAILPSFNKLTQLILRLAPSSTVENTRKKLLKAGNPGGLDAMAFLSLKTLFALLLPILFFLLSLPFLLILNLLIWDLLFLPALIVIGWFLLDVWITLLIRNRRSRIARILPDAIDLLVVSVEAGLALDAALTRVSMYTSNPLKDELQKTVSELSVGKTRKDALRDLSERNDSDDLRSFISAILQADRLGTSIGQVLRVQAQSIRVKRRQRAEEQAAQAPIKAVFPLGLCIFPTLMIVLLGPVFIQLLDQFNKLNIGK